MKRLLTTVFCVVLTTFAFAQSDTVKISSIVLDTSGEPLEVCIVAVLAPQDSTIITYGMTDEEGRCRTQFVTAYDEVLLRLTGFNLKRQVKRIKARTQTINFTAEEENMVLREVMVKAQKLWGSRDTLNYLVSAYMKDQDRTIGDVLRQLPGITIEESGVIKYQGTPINHFYIENLDMLQGRYNLATEGIKAEDVATVQVLENHEHVKALQDQVPPESAAINLKLKEKSKGVWTKSADFAAGIYGDGPLWDATLQAMYFGKNEQHLLRYRGDNMGHGHSAATAHYGASSASGAQMVGIVGHGSSPVGNSMFGYHHDVNLNNLAKLSEDATLNYNLNYSHRLTRGESYTRTTYILPTTPPQPSPQGEGAEQLPSTGVSIDKTNNNTPSPCGEGWGGVILTENIADRTHTNSADLQLTYEKNAEKKFLNNTLSLSGKWNEGKSTPPQPSPQGEGVKQLPSTDALIDKTNYNTPSPCGEGRGEVLHYRSLSLSNRTRWVHRTENGGGFEWTSTNSLSTAPQALAISGDMTARQDVDITTMSTANNFETLHDLRAHRWTLAASAHANATYTYMIPL